MISPSWGLPPRRRQRWGESRFAVALALCLQVGNTLAGGHGVEHMQSKPVPEVAALIAATSAAPKGRRSPSWPPADLHGQLSDPLHGAIQFRLHRIALALLERGADPADRFLAPLLRAGRSLRPTGATEVAPARHATLARHRPSLAKSQQEPGLGKTWTSQARPHLPGAFFGLSVMQPPWTLRLSQFCVQGNRVRLNRHFIEIYLKSEVNDTDGIFQEIRASLNCRIRVPDYSQIVL